MLTCELSEVYQLPLPPLVYLPPLPPLPAPNARVCRDGLPLRSLIAAADAESRLRLWALGLLETCLLVGPAA